MTNHFNTHGQNYLMELKNLSKLNSSEMRATVVLAGGILGREQETMYAGAVQNRRPSVNFADMTWNLGQLMVSHGEQRELLKLQHQGENKIKVELAWM